jgi:glutathione S-transferase
MKLYYAETLSPRKACAFARYLGSPVEFVPVDLAKGEQRGPAFRAINPNGKVPTLTDGDTVGLGGERDHVLPRREAGSDLWPGDERQIEVVRWLSWDADHFTRHAGSLYFEHIIKRRFGIGAPDPAAVEEATGHFRRFAGVLGDHLRGREYLVGESLTVADFAVAVTLPYADEARLPLGEFPEVERWHARLWELPAWREPFPRTAIAQAA